MANPEVGTGMRSRCWTAQSLRFFPLFWILSPLLAGTQAQHVIILKDHSIPILAALVRSLQVRRQTGPDVAAAWPLSFVDVLEEREGKRPASYFLRSPRPTLS